MPWTLSIRVNIPDLIECDKSTIWEEIKEILISPLEEFINSKTTIVNRSSGIHTRGKSCIPHVHLNYLIENDIPNFTKNYKYNYEKNQRNNLPKEKRAEYKCPFFKEYKHSIRQGTEYFWENNNPILQPVFGGSGDLKGFLAYPYKEVSTYEDMWKVGVDDIITPFKQQDLIVYGASIYLEAIKRKQKKEESEDKKLEKWGAFCKYMDDLRETPTKYEMTDLRGVCHIALNYFRDQPERNSVNAIITMCKDYAFKRNIWTNMDILEKYNIC